MPIKPLINYDDFAKLDLRVGKILDCESVKNSDKLLKYTIDIGTSKRQILAGVRQWYDPSEMIGKTVVIIANLEPKKMVGLTSQGMILMADDPDKPVLISPESEAKKGTIVR